MKYKQIIKNLLYIYFLLFTVHCSLFTVYAAPLYDKKYLQDIIDTGDRYFSKQDYVFAFNEYKKALSIDNKIDYLHYRMARVYGFLNPDKKYADREYALALYFWMKKYVDLKKINVLNMRNNFKIPINPKEGENPTHLNPIRFIRRDIDGDKKDEIFVLLRRGSKSYVFFVLEYYDFYPKVHHLVTFYEGESGFNDIKFIDLNSDGREEILIECNMKDFLNLMIFTKNYYDKYTTVLNKIGIFQGNYIISDIIKGDTKEIEIFGKNRDTELFSKEHGPYISFKTLYQWGSRVAGYTPYMEEVLHDHIFVLEIFLKAIMVEKDFDKAYELVDPELLLKNFKGTYDMNPFKDFFKKEGYNILLAENGADRFIGKIELQENPVFNAKVGWDEGNIKQDKMARVRDDYKSLRLILDKKISFLLEMQYKDGWKIINLKKENTDNGFGWHKEQNKGFL